MGRSEWIALAVDSPRQRLHLPGVTEPHEKDKPQKKLRFRVARPPQSVWKGKEIITSKTNTKPNLVLPIHLNKK